MVKLKENAYLLIGDLVKDVTPNLAIFAVIHGQMPGKIFVDHEERPTSAFIQTSEGNFLLGNPNNTHFNRGVKEEVDFWEGLMFHGEAWEGKIAEVHPNKFLRKYTRRHYVLKSLPTVPEKESLKEGYTLVQVDPRDIAACGLKNADKVMAWILEWGSIQAFQKKGVGFMIQNEEAIVSWSLTDCVHDKRAAMGVHCDAKYRKNGFGTRVAAATAAHCLSQGIQEVEWHCVDTNRGSIAMAENLGFLRKHDYDAYTSYPPIENKEDLTREQWAEWALYYEHVLEEEPRLFMDCVLCWMKANDVDAVMRLLNKRIETGWQWTLEEVSDFFKDFQKNEKWAAYLKYLKTLWG